MWRTTWLPAIRGAGRGHREHTLPRARPARTAAHANARRATARTHPADDREALAGTGGPARPIHGLACAVPWRRARLRVARLAGLVPGATRASNRRRTQTRSRRAAARAVGVSE